MTRRHFLWPQSREALAALCAVGLCASDLETQAQTGGGDAPVAPETQEQAFEVALPVVFDRIQLAPVRTRSSLSAIIAVSPQDLANALDGRIVPEAVEELRRMGDDLVAVGVLERVGVRATLDPTTLSVAVDVDPNVRAESVINLTGEAGGDAFTATPPSNLAAGVTFNVTGGSLIYDDEDAGFDDGAFVGVASDGFVNAWGREGVTLDFGFSTIANLNDGDGFSDLARDRVTLFHDDVDGEIRYSLGDVRPETPRLAGSPEYVGFSIERRFGVIQPGETVRPTGDRELFLERRATVEVVVNGAVVRRFVAGPGPVDITGIPFTETTNDVEIIVEDRFGRRTVDTFSFGSDQELLAPGLFEFSFAGGVSRQAFDDSDEFLSFDYDDDASLVAAMKYGMTSQLTSQGFVSGGDDYASGGAGVVVGTGYGIFSLDAAASLSDGEAGFALDSAFVTRFAGPFNDSDRFALTGEFRSMEFADVTNRDNATSEEWRARGVFNFELTETASSSLGGSFRREEDEDEEITQSYELSMGLGEQFGPFSVNVLGSRVWYRDDENELRGFIAVSYSLGPRTVARTRYDTAANSVVAEVRRNAYDIVGDYGFSASVEHDDDDLSVFGSGVYVGNRYEVEVSAERFLPRDGDPNGTELSGRFQTGFAYVDGRFAIGRDPGRGFVLVDTHDTLDEGRVAIVNGSGSDTALARSDWLGPAVAPMGAPHSTMNVNLDFDNVPLGYDVGPGSYVVQTGASTGVAIEIGSDANYTVVGALFFEGEPVSLRSGVAVRSAIDEDEGAEAIAESRQVIFTNRTGRFVLNGASSGLYRIEIDGGRFVAVVDVPESDNPYVEIGQVELTRR